jgi:cGMP-dependent protein kinase 1
VGYLKRVLSAKFLWCILKKKTGKKYFWLSKAISFFSILTSKQCKFFLKFQEDSWFHYRRDTVVKNMYKFALPAGNYVFKEGDMDAQTFYVISKGKVAVEISNVKKAFLGEWHSFGELALLYSCPRSASILAEENCEFWCLDRYNFKSSLEKVSMIEYEENRKFLEKTSMFKYLSPEQKDHLTRLVTTQKFEPGEDIVRKGDMASSYYIIKEGVVACMQDENTIVRHLYSGDTFGEQALYFKSQRMLTVKAVEVTKVIAVARDKIASILGGQIQEIVTKSFLRWRFLQHQTYSQLASIDREKIIELFIYKVCKKGDQILKAGSKIRKVVVIIKGRAHSVSYYPKA